MSQKEFLLEAKKYFEEQIRLSEYRCEENRKRLEVVNCMLLDGGIVCEETMMEDGDISEKEIDEAIIKAVKIGLKNVPKEEALPDDMKNIDWNANHVKEAVDRLFDALFGGVIKEE